MSLLVNDFTFLEGRDGELVVKESPTVTGSRQAFKRPYCWEEVPAFNARMNQAIDHECNWNEGDILYSELETGLHPEASSAVKIYCFGPQKTQFISCIMVCTITDNTQLGYLPLADKVYQASAERLHVTSSDMFVLCGRPIH